MRLYLRSFSFITLFIYVAFADNCPASFFTKIQNADLVPSPGNTYCGDAVNEDLNTDNDNWCTCFKWPEAVEILNTEATTDCTLNDASAFTVQDAYAACTSLSCSQITAEALCRSRSCTWSTGACSDDTVCSDDDSLAAQVAVELEVPWVTNCEQFRAVLEHYHGKTCDDDVLMVMDEVEAAAPGEYLRNSTLRDLCCETCEFADFSVPYVYGEYCTSDSDCVDSDTANDYFCANCTSEACQTSGECGICDMTLYPGSACAEMAMCQDEKTMSGACNFIHEECPIRGGFILSDIEACGNYFAAKYEYPPEGEWGSEDYDLIALNACPCFLDPEFTETEQDCVFKWQDKFTLAEMRTQCSNNCTDVYSKDVCVSTASGCSWISRLVKGKCVDDPCLSPESLDCAQCALCVTDAVGSQSCEFNEAMEGEECEDPDPETNSDICRADSPQTNYCKGVSVWEQIEANITLNLCEDGVGITYTCADEAMNETYHSGLLCNNQTVDMYSYKMDGSCSNVVANDVFTTKYPFSGVCTETTAKRTRCTETEYFLWLTSQQTDFEEPEDGIERLSVVVALIVALMFL